MLTRSADRGALVRLGFATQARDQGVWVIESDQWLPTNLVIAFERA